MRRGLSLAPWLTFFAPWSSKEMNFRSCHLKKVSLLLPLGLQARTATSAAIDTTSLELTFQPNAVVNSTSLNAFVNSTNILETDISQFHCLFDESWIGPRRFRASHCDWALTWLQTKVAHYGSQDLNWPSKAARGPATDDAIFTPNKFRFSKGRPRAPQKRSVR